MNAFGRAPPAELPTARIAFIASSSGFSLSSVDELRALGEHLAREPHERIDLQVRAAGDRRLLGRLELERTDPAGADVAEPLHDVEARLLAPLRGQPGVHERRAPAIGQGVRQQSRQTAEGVLAAGRGSGRAARAAASARARSRCRCERTPGRTGTSRSAPPRRSRPRRSGTPRASPPRRSSRRARRASAHHPTSTARSSASPDPSADGPDRDRDRDRGNDRWRAGGPCAARVPAGRSGDRSTRGSRASSPASSSSARSSLIIEVIWTDSPRSARCTVA